MEEKVRGRCLCGHVVYEIAGPVGPANYCHCEDCRRCTGSAFNIGVRCETAGFRILSGATKGFTKRGDSGNELTRNFCPECGSPIFTSSLRHPETGELAWFNQAHLFRLHPRYLGVRRYLLARALFRDPETRSHHAWLGDGSEIDRATLEHLYDVLGSHQVPVAWESGDVLAAAARAATTGEHPVETPPAVGSTRDATDADFPAESREPFLPPVTPPARPGVPEQPDPKRRRRMALVGVAVALAAAVIAVLAINPFAGDGKVAGGTETTSSTEESSAAAEEPGTTASADTSASEAGATSAAE